MKRNQIRWILYFDTVPDHLSAIMIKISAVSLLFSLTIGAAQWRCQTDNAATPPPMPAQATSSLTVVAPETGVALVDEDYLLGRFDPAKHPDFEAVKAPYSDRPAMMMRREALDAFKKMHAAAKKEGIVLKIISSTRTFAQQKSIWEGKWKRFATAAPDPEARALKILEYSSMPGSSRHHWGTDIDLNDLNNPAFEPGGKYAKTYEWLTAHAHEYGFCQPYTAKGEQRPNGYNEERWHWSYTPLSKSFLKQYLSQITEDRIQGFEGAETAKTIQVVKYYVGGIHSLCTP